MSYFDLSGFDNRQVKNATRPLPPSLLFNLTEADAPSNNYSYTPSLPDRNPYYDLNSSEAQRYQEAGMRHALSQGMGIFNDPNAPPIPAEYQQRIDKIHSALDPGPLEQKYQKQLAEAFAQPKAHGFLAHLAGFGKGLLMGEGLPGAIRGAVDPTTMNLRYKLAQMQPLFGGMKVEQELADSGLKSAKQMSELSGYDPFTGLPTPKYDYWSNYLGPAAIQRAQTGQQRADTYQQITNARIDQIHEKFKNLPFDHFIKAYNSGALNNDPDALIEMATRAGIANADKIEPKFLAGMIKTVVNDKYGVDTVNLQTGKVTSTGVTSVEKPKQAESMKRAVVNAGGHTTPEERKEDRQIRQGHLTVAQQAERDRQDVAAQKQAESEVPMPHFASEAQINERNQKVAARKAEILKNKPAVPSTPSSQQSAQPPLQAGERIIKKQRYVKGSKQGQLLWTIQRPNGTTYSYPPE